MRYRGGNELTWFIVWVVAAVLVGALAGQRERSGFGWFLLALVISPLLAGLGLLIAGTGAQQVRCPACRELVRADAVKCKHCGEALNGLALADVAELERYHKDQTGKALMIIGAIGLVGLLIGLATR